MRFIAGIAAVIIAGMSFAQQERMCGTDQILQQLKAQYPDFEQRMHHGLMNAANGDGELTKSTMYIPVVVHIIHDNGVGNISDQQVLDALAVLNTDYNRQNSDASATRNTPSAPFAAQAGMMDVKFRLAQIDPDGNCTNGILRVNAPGLTYNADDACKYAANGGSDQWPMDKYINIWVVNSIAGGGTGIILGYAYLPYFPNGENYGILIRHDSFGTIETASTADGRTLTHEMGHLLGLQHIFDAGWNGADGCHTDDCNQAGDYCCDTPPQQQSYWGCQTALNSCAEIPLNDSYGIDVVDQIENYMSYNACQNMFSIDQIGLMSQNFIDINFMAAMITPANIIATGINNPQILCKSDFDASRTSMCPGDSVIFNDRSFHNPSSWNWSVSPGIQGTDWDFCAGGTSTTQNPSIRFYTPGSYTIVLTVSDGTNTATEEKTSFITVLPSAQSLPFWEGFESITDLSNEPFWTINNPGGNNGFDIETGAAYTGNQSTHVYNFNQSGSNVDELISSSVDLSTIPTTGTVTLSFRYAYRKRNVSNDEWLKVYISKNCGDDWVQRRTIHGDNLSPFVATSQWSPSFPSDWVTVHMTNVTSDFFVENFRFKFRFEGNGGNNFFIDDINIYPGAPSDELVLGLTNELGLAELSVYPNPADNEANVRFTLPSVTRLSVDVCDLSGKVISHSMINGAEGINIVTIPLTNLASGMYQLRISDGVGGKVLPLVVR
jgi:PKD repeat protein